MRRTSRVVDIAAEDSEEAADFDVGVREKAVAMKSNMKVVSVEIAFLEKMERGQDVADLEASDHAAEVDSDVEGPDAHLKRTTTKVVRVDSKKVEVNVNNVLDAVEAVAGSVEVAAEELLHKKNEPSSFAPFYAHTTQDLR